MDLKAPLKVVLADDEPMARARLSRLLSEAGCEVLAEFGEGSTLLEYLAQRPRLDALFLDIQMPGPSGLEVAAELPFPLPVVFVTASRDHSLDAFELDAADYLLKPVRAERLIRTLDRLRAGLIQPQGGNREPAQVPQRVIIKAGEGLVFLDIRKVTHFEVEEDTVWAWTAGQRFASQWKTLNEVEASFPEASLLRIQRHLLIRPECISGLRPLSGNRAMARIGEQELEVSRTATALLKKALGIKGEFGKRD
ncbi:MAG: response regulator [Holophagaceae bacterium]|nr:response regulator [Holophagaceae bacterium]